MYYIVTLVSRIQGEPEYNINLNILFGHYKHSNILAPFTQW